MATASNNMRTKSYTSHTYSDQCSKLRNIQSMIRLTRGNLEQLNARFAEYQHPPSMYVHEYEDLTSKLNEFQNEEQRLLEQVSQEQCLSSEDVEQMMCSTSGSSYCKTLDDDPSLIASYPCYSTCVSPANGPPNGFVNGIGTCNTCATYTNGPNSPPTPHSPLKSVVRVHLPNLQRSTVHARPGQSVKDALIKAMRRRRLSAETCDVFMAGHEYRRISWDEDISCYEGAELIVTTREKFPISTSISHNFVRKTFFTLAFCECCQRLLFYGFRCQTCGFRFHQRCAAGVPPLCNPLRVHPSNYSDLYYSHLLALNNTATSDDAFRRDVSLTASFRSPISSASSACSQRDQPAPVVDQRLLCATNSSFAARERSTSAPNVCFNAVNGPICALDEALVRQAVYCADSNGLVRAQPSTGLPGNLSKGHQPPSSQQLPANASYMLAHHHSHAHHLHHNHHPLHHPNLINSSGLMQTPAGTIGSLCSASLWRPRARSTDDGSGKKIVCTPKCAHCPAFNPKCPNCVSLNSAKLASYEDWEIPVDEIITGHRIGSGSFGTVFRGHWHGPVAIKRLNVSNPNPAQLQAFKNEVGVLRKTRHVNILLFMGCVSRDRQLAIVTQWCEGSSLYKHLHVLDTKFDLFQSIDISRQTAQGMDYLHAKNIIHRDLKSNSQCSFVFHGFFLLFWFRLTF
jgi:B-Raf proto-oncogene serine/threonine-protein kinase